MTAPPCGGGGLQLEKQVDFINSQKQIMRSCLDVSADTNEKNVQSIDLQAASHRGKPGSCVSAGKLRPLQAGLV